MLIGRAKCAPLSKRVPDFLGNMTSHLKRAARIKIQPRSLNGRAFA